MTNMADRLPSKDHPVNVMRHITQTTMKFSFLGFSLSAYIVLLCTHNPHHNVDAHIVVVTENVPEFRNTD